MIIRHDSRKALARRVPPRLAVADTSPATEPGAPDDGFLGVAEADIPGIRAAVNPERRNARIIVR